MKKMKKMMTLAATYAVFVGVAVAYAEIQPLLPWCWLFLQC